jgi:aminopeptidase
VGAWAREAPLELVGSPAPLLRSVLTEADAFLAILAPRNTRAASDVPRERLAACAAAQAPLRERMTAMRVPWTICQFPTHALAQEAEMTLAQLEDFVFGACLRDWDAERERMLRIAEALDRAREVRLVGDATDLLLSVDGRTCEIDDAHINMPGGEVFVSPLEDATEGIVTFAEFPAAYFGQVVVGAWLRFADGRVIDAGAAANEAFLLETLETDRGAGVLGELGIGCNRGITRYMRNTLFDEKIAGTVHLALGASYAVTGGRNHSDIHWDIVKDLRRGGELYLDGRLVQRDGEWLEAVAGA